MIPPAILIAVPALAACFLIWEAFDLGGWLKVRRLRRTVAAHEAAEERARQLEEFSRRWAAERFEAEALRGISEIPVREPRRRVR